MVFLAPNKRGLADTRANHRWLPVHTPPSTLCARVRKPPAFRTELNGIERSERIAGAVKYAARHCLRRNLAVHYAANTLRAAYQSAKLHRKHLREFARKRKKYTCFAAYA